MKPDIEIPVTLGNGETDYWGLTSDDGCVVVMRKQGGEWKPHASAWVPSPVAAHMGTIATLDIALHQAFDAAISVQYDDPDDDGETEEVAGTAAQLN